jgi:hypothetical protein
MSSRPKLKIDWATYEAAKYACQHWHYSKKIPVNKLLKIGVWEDGAFIGVIIFGVGASAVIHKQFGLKNTEVCELVRIALKEHKTPVSRMISIALRFLRANASKIRVVVSFADPNEGHHGGIYQATNWIYTGKSAITTEYFYNGDWRHKTDVYKRVPGGGKAIKQLKSRKKPGKYRYIMPLDDEMQKRIEPLRKPYPKRDKQAIGGDQPHSGGAAPTVTLQKNDRCFFGD